MSECKILIVSDLHVGKPEDANNTTRLTVATPDKPLCDNPIGALKKFILDRGLSFDLLVNLGDVTNRGYIPGWNMGMRMLSSLAKDVDCPLLSTPGNHDYCFDFEGGALDLLKRTNDYPTNDNDVNVHFWGKGFCIYNCGNVQILIINSENYLRNAGDLAICPNYDTFCDNDLAQYLDENEHHGPKIAIIHHHVIQHSDMVGKYTSNDVIEHADKLLELLEARNFSCVIHGHKHLPRFNTRNNMGIFACGSLSCLENIRTSDEDNYFHIMTIVSEEENIRGKIETFHYILQKGWFPIEDTNAHVKSIYGFGSQINVADLVNKIIECINEQPTPVLDISLDADTSKFPELAFLSNEGLKKLEELVTAQGFKFFHKSPKIIIYK